jgi:hypothetical protein
MSDVMRVHIGKEEWTLGEFVDAFLSYRGRSELAEEAVDYCNREMNNALAQVDHLKARAEKAEQDLAVERQLSSQLLKTSDNRAVLLEKAERERDEAKATLETYRSVAGVAERTAEELREQLGSRRAHRCTCKSCEGPLTCAKCVPVREDWTPTLASRLEKLEARVVPVFCAVCGAGNGHHGRVCRLGMPPACGHGDPTPGVCKTCGMACSLAMSQCRKCRGSDR